MFCMNCGRNLPDNAKFCDGCGTPVSREVPAQPPQPPQRTQPQYRLVEKPAVKKSGEKLPVWVILVIVLLLAGAAVLFVFLGRDKADASAPADAPAVSERTYRTIGKTTLSDLTAGFDWSYCALTEYEPDVVQGRGMNTSSSANAMLVWDEIRVLELTQVEMETWMEDVIGQESFLSAYLTAGSSSFSVRCFEDGFVLASLGEEDWAFTDGKKLYSCLLNRLPHSDSLSMNNVFPDDDWYWFQMIITYENEDGTAYGKVSEFTTGDLNEIVDQLRRCELGYGPLAYSYGRGCRSVRVTMDPLEDGLPVVSHNINEDGTGTVSRDGWTYGVTNTHALYDTLLKILDNYGD